MANELLKSLTIDGVEMDVSRQKIIGADKKITIATANAKVEGASIAVADFDWSSGERRCYVIFGRVEFASAAATGTTVHSLSIKSGTETITSNQDVDATNTGVMKQIIGYLHWPPSQNINITVSSNKPITSSFKTTLLAYRIW